MSDDTGTVVPLNAEDADCIPRIVAGVEIPAPPPGAHLDRQRRRLYDWICVQLVKDGRKIRTAGIQIVMLVHTIDGWSKDMADCIKLGRYATSKKGGRYELPHSFNERKAREEIKSELPEACLTVMSTIEARLKEAKTPGAEQDDLFAELLDLARQRPRAA